MSTTNQTEGEAYARKTDPATAHAAAKDVQGERASHLERAVLNALRHANGGLTNDELADNTGIAWRSITPRIAPLRRKGLVFDSLQRRPGKSGRLQIVWTAVPTPHPMPNQYEGTKAEIGSSGKFPNPKPKKGFSLWIENGVWYTAPTVPRKFFGGHAYDNGGYEAGIRECPCGCHMGSSSSSGPVDPFGPCPQNPKGTAEPPEDLRNLRLPILRTMLAENRLRYRQLKAALEYATVVQASGGIAGTGACAEYKPAATSPAPPA